MKAWLTRPLALIFFVLFLSSSAAVHADTVYSYTGTDFTSWTGTSCPPACNITGSLTLVLPLLPGLNFADVTPFSFSFTDGITTWTNLNAPGGIFEFSTDPTTGAITFWIASLAKTEVPSQCDPASGDLRFLKFESTSSFALNSGDAICATDTSFSTLYEAENESSGMWSPPMTGGTPVPEPETLLLLGTGLTSILVPRRRRKLWAAKVLTLGLACLWLAGGALAQNSIWTGGNGNWSDSTKWNGGVPTSTSLVLIDNNDALISNVTLDTNARVSELITTSGDSFTVNGRSGTQLNFWNLTADEVLLNGNTSIVNGGSITVNVGATNNGLLTLGGGNAKGLEGVLNGSGTLINNSDITGSGTIAINVYNGQGNIVGTNGAPLTLDGATVTGGGLVGEITARNGASVKDMEVGHNDPLSLTAGSTLGVLGTVTNTGEVILGAGATLNGTGTIMNHGAIRGPGTIAVNVNGTGGQIVGANGAPLILDGAMVTGGRLIEQITALNGTTVKDVEFGHNDALALTAGSTLGILGTETNAGGVILGAGATLSGSGTIVNNSTIRGPGTISTNVTSTIGGTVEGDAGAPLTLDGAILTGGILRGTVTALNGATVVDGDLGHNNIALTLTAGSTLNIQGTVNDAGALILGAGAVLTDSGTLMNNSLLAGRGTVTVNVISNNLGATIEGDAGAPLTFDGAILTGGILRGDIAALNGTTLQDARLGKEAGDVINLTSGSTLRIQGTVTDFGRLSTASGSTLEVQGALINRGNISTGGMINNSGGISNSGLLQVGDGGVLNNTGGIGNIQGGAFVVQSGGTLNNSGTLINDFTSIFVSAANSTIVNTGVMVLSGPAINVGGNLRDDGSIILMAGPITGDPPIQPPAPPLNVASTGTLSGTGVVDGVVEMQGTMRPGDSPGTFTINGIYTQDAQGTLDILLGGTGAGEFGQLMVNGDAVLGGTLDVELFAGFDPESGDVFEILSGKISGSFADILFPTLADGLFFKLDQEANGIFLDVLAGTGGGGDGGGGNTPVPEPSTLALIGVSFAAMFGFRSRKRFVRE